MTANDEHANKRWLRWQSWETWIERVVVDERLPRFKRSDFDVAVDVLETSLHDRKKTIAQRTMMQNLRTKTNQSVQHRYDQSLFTYLTNSEKN